MTEDASLELLLRDLALASVAAPPADHAAAPWQAAVAALLRSDPAGSPELLLIRRAERDGDVWSGHLALPGGRVDPSDDSLRATARRETFEEIGVDLTEPTATFVAALEPVTPRAMPRPVAVHPFAWHVRGPVDLQPNEEVAAAMWVPVARLVDPATAVEHRLGERTFPGVAVGGDVLWGLTLRIVQTMLARTARP